MWLMSRARRWGNTNMVMWLTADMTRQRVAKRYYPGLLDEIQRGDDTIHRPLPWWCPFNAILHQWATHDDVLMHDHPRRSVTVVLRGQLTEKTPWGDRVLRPGSVVLRSHRFIHGFRVDPEHSCRTWTLFIVGRRRWLQNTYAVTRRTGTPER